MNLLSAALLLLVSVAVHATMILCPFDEETDFQITVISRRNKTGHWIAEVKMDHDGSGSADSGPWEMKVHQSTLIGIESKAVRIEINAVVPPKPNPKPDDYEEVPGMGVYKLHITEKTWDEAHITCKEEGAHLVILEDYEEMVGVTSMTHKTLPADHGKFFWIGYDNQSSEEHSSELGRPENVLQLRMAPPYKREPEKRCGCIDQKGFYQQQYCSNTNYFICER